MQTCCCCRYVAFASLRPVRAPRSSQRADSFLKLSSIFLKDNGEYAKPSPNKGSQKTGSSTRAMPTGNYKQRHYKSRQNKDNKRTCVRSVSEISIRAPVAPPPLGRNTLSNKCWQAWNLLFNCLTSNGRASNLACVSCNSV